jgi:hypothetical protein
MSILSRLDRAYQLWGFGMSIRRAWRVARDPVYSNVLTKNWHLL